MILDKAIRDALLRKRRIPVYFRPAYLTLQTFFPLDNKDLEIIEKGFRRELHDDTESEGTNEFDSDEEVDIVGDQQPGPSAPRPSRAEIARLQQLPQSIPPLNLMQVLAILEHNFPSHYIANSTESNVNPVNAQPVVVPVNNQEGNTPAPSSSSVNHPHIQRA